MEIVYELPLLSNNTANVTFFLQIRSGAKCFPDVYHWDTRLVVIVPIHDIVQNVLLLYPWEQEARTLW
jgi:hypothetical protein